MLGKRLIVSLKRGNSFRLVRVWSGNQIMLRQLLSSKCREANNDRIHERYQIASQTIIGLCAVNRERDGASKCTKPVRMAEMWKKLNTLAIFAADLDALPVIHVSGTKGKGSTCAFITSILENHGIRTGFFSSPHLVEIRERIRLGGKPISKQLFCEHFDYVYEKLQTAHATTSCHGYFEFLTLMALRAFIVAKVDVAVLEVGIGGELDFTNIVTNVPVCVITALGLDHCNLLGNTIEEIAWQKAGIIKRDSSAITIDTQPSSAIEVIRTRALQNHVYLDIVGNCLRNFQWACKNDDDDDDENFLLSTRNEAIQQNASLAVYAAFVFLHKRGKIPVHMRLDRFLKDARTQRGLRTCRWPGRFQRISCDHIDFFLDGAHTDESIRLCVEWFGAQLDLRRRRRRSEHFRKILIFNLTRNRSHGDKLAILSELDFDLVIFTTNFTYENFDDISKDTFTDKKLFDNQLNMCQTYEEYWQANICRTTKTFVTTSIEKAIELVLEHSNHKQTDVLVTGSLILIGNLLSILKPDLNKSVS